MKPGCTHINKEQLQNIIENYPIPLYISVSLTNKEKKEENENFSKLINSFSLEEANNILTSFSYKIYPYVVKEWASISPDFIHALKKYGLDLGIQTTNHVKGFFGKLKTNIHKSLNLNEFINNIKTFSRKNMDINLQKIKENEGKITDLNNKTFFKQFQGEITEYANTFLFLIY